MREPMIPSPMKPTLSTGGRLVTGRRRRRRAAAARYAAIAENGSTSSSSVSARCWCEGQ